MDGGSCKADQDSWNRFIGPVVGGSRTGYRKWLPLFHYVGINEFSRDRGDPRRHPWIFPKVRNTVGRIFSSVLPIQRKYLMIIGFQG
jgi:hypothetical protein